MPSASFADYADLLLALPATARQLAERTGMRPQALRATRWRKTLAMRVWSMFHAAQDQRARLGRAADREGAQP